MDTGFTRGEWKITDKTEKRFVLKGPDIDVWSILMPRAEAEANAKLIAAAPKMFEALIDIYNDEEAFSDLSLSQQSKVVTAITKATE